MDWDVYPRASKMLDNFWSPSSHEAHRSRKNNTTIVTVCNSSNISEPYVCLSHCWGTSGHSDVTTTANLESKMLGIPIESLPQTFLDAIIIVQKIGLEYLWVDSLCIIQDDRDDWEKESAKMAGIYQGAFLTIAATASSSNRDGMFFTMRESTHHIDYRIP
jgi:hypothetical protein